MYTLEKMTKKNDIHFFHYDSDSQPLLHIKIAWGVYEKLYVGMYYGPIKSVSVKGWSLGIHVF